MPFIGKKELYRSFIPIIIILIVSPICVFIFNITAYEPPNVTPFEDSGLGSVYNLLIFLSITTIFGVLLIYLVKKPKTLKLLSTLLLAYLSFATTMFYIDAIIYQMNISYTYQMLLEIGISLIISLLLVLSIYKKFHYLYSTLILLVSVGVGVLLNFTIPLNTKILLLIGYSIFDYFSVTRGFINKIFSSSHSFSILDLFLVRFSQVGLGIGDIIFYSLLISLSLDILSFNVLIGYLLSSLSIVIGHTINLYILLKRKVIPALPIPTMLCLSLILMAKTIL